ncbi:MAG: TonB-dependent receptor [Bacteroidales bacterium]
MKTIKLLLFLFISAPVFSQNMELKGVISDVQTNEKLNSVHLQLIDEMGHQFNSITNLQGEFMINKLASGNYKLTATYLGYKKFDLAIVIQSKEFLEIKLERESITLGEVVVSSVKHDQIIKEVAAPLEIVDRKQIESSSSVTVSDVLQQEPGVAVSRDGVWATGVNIRGLGEQRIVMMVDGNRIETATDLMASLTFFDVDDIDRIEVIKGASSSLYGTGAMGGIVNVISKDGYFNSTPYFNGSFNSGFGSVNEFFTRKLTVNSGSDRWFVRLTGALRDAGDIKTPNGTIQNSQFSDESISLSAGLSLFDNHTLKINYQYFDANDVGIPGGLAFPGPATATYADAKREMFSANYEIKNISTNFKSLNIKYYNQFISRDVELLPNSSVITPTRITTPELTTPVGDHTTNGFQVQSNWSFSSNNNFIAGIDAWQRNVLTSREKYIRVDVLNTSGDTIATNNLVRGETPMPESSFGTAGIYFQNEQKMLNNDLKVIVGGRFDGVRIANEQAFDYDYLITNGVRNDTPPNQRITFEKNEEYKSSWSANVGLLYAVAKDMDLSFNAGRSFRAPSLEESFKYIDLGNMVRLGDPNLDPEKGYSLDLGYRIWKPNFHFKISGFINWLSDMIVEVPGEFIYTYTTGTVDTIPALINSNVDEARLYGVDVNFEYNFYKPFTLYGLGSFVRGEDTKNDKSLPLIPPVNGRLGLRYELLKYAGIDLIAVGFADQTKVAEGEKTTMGYARFDMAIHSSIINAKFFKFQLFGGLENIGNRSYSSHLSTNRGTMDYEPGRNAYIKLKVLF